MPFMHTNKTSRGVCFSENQRDPVGVGLTSSTLVYIHFITTHPNVWQLVQVEEAQQVERLLSVVVLGKSQCVNKRSHSVNDPTKVAFK